VRASKRQQRVAYIAPSHNSDASALVLAGARWRAVLRRECLNVVKDIRRGNNGETAGKAYSV